MSNPYKGKFPLEDTFKVDWTQFSEEQVQAIELLSLPGKGGMTFEQIAEYVGVSVRTIHRWRDKKEFQMAVNQRSVNNLHNELPEVFQAHVKSAKRGNIKAIELLYKVMGLYIEKQEVKNEVNQTVEDKTQDNDEVENDIKRLRGLVNEDEEDENEKPGKAH